MYDQPENVHRIMKFFMEEHLHFQSWFEKEGLLSLANEDDYVGSGGPDMFNEFYPEVSGSHS